MKAGSVFAALGVVVAGCGCTAVGCENNVLTVKLKTSEGPSPRTYQGTLTIERFGRVDLDCQPETNNISNVCCSVAPENPNVRTTSFRSGSETCFNPDSGLMLVLPGHNDVDFLHISLTADDGRSVDIHKEVCWESNSPNGAFCGPDCDAASVSTRWSTL